MMESPLLSAAGMMLSSIPDAVFFVAVVIEEEVQFRPGRGELDQEIVVVDENEIIVCIGHFMSKLFKKLHQWSERAEWYVHGSLRIYESVVRVRKYYYGYWVLLVQKVR